MPAGIPPSFRGAPGRIFLAFVSYVVFSLLEVLLHQHFFYAEMPAETRAFIVKTIQFAPGPLLLFLLQFHVCLAVLAVATEVLRYLAGVRSILGPVVYVIAVALLFNLSEIPQVFSMTIDGRWIDVAAWLLVPVLISLPCLALFGIYRGRAHAAPVASTFGVYAKVAGLTISIGILGLYNARSPGVFDRPQRSALEQVPDNSVLVLSLDSLRPDFVADYVEKNPSSELARLSKESVQFDRIITTTAKTHASLTALLTGERPEQHGMRDNLFPGFMESDRLYAGKGLISVLRGRDFSTRLILDETKFAQFTEGAAFDDVIAPDYGYMNLLVSEVFKSNLYWSYFANDFGHLILPEAKLNFAFSQGYKPKDFLREMYRQVESKNGHPVFLLAHTCALHYPGDSRTPYLQRYQTEPENLVTRYPNFFKKGKTTEDATLKQYGHLTRGKLDMIMDEVVEPFLKDLRGRGTLDRIHLVLMSDHGETFWKPGLRYSRLQLPYHGQPAILDEDSQEMFALIRSPRLAAERVSSVQSITDLTRYLIEAVDAKQVLPAISSRPSSQYRYTESGMLGYGIFNSALNLAARVVIDGYDFTPNGGMLIRPDQVNGLIVQKTRTIYGLEHHWSFFPTTFGYETVVCRPPNCWSPGSRDVAELADLARFYNHETTIDQKAGISFPLSNQIGRAGDVQWNFANAADLQPVARWYRGVHELNADGNILGAYQNWMSVLKGSGASSASSEEEKFRAFRSLLEICAVPSPPGARLAGSFCSEFNDWIGERRRDPSILGTWAAMSEEWSDFLRGQWYIRDIVEKLGLSPKNSAGLDVDDDFSKVFLQAVRSKKTAEFRKFVHERRTDLVMDLNFFRRFWTKASLQPPKNLEEARVEIGRIRDQVSAELGLKFYEVDLNWISSLQRYSELEGFDVFTEEATRFLEESRLPFAPTVRVFVPKVLKLSDERCYQERILPRILAENPTLASPKRSWQANFLEKARALLPICSR